MPRRTPLALAAALAGLAALPALAQQTPGVTATTIKIGNTNPYSGPASAYSAIAKGETAFFKMVDDKGGIAGHKIDFISLDDGYAPPKTVEQTRKLVEEDGVAFLFNGLGTPSQTAVEKYLNDKKVPQLFVASGADKWGDYKHYPWTMGWQPSYRTEAQIYAKYILANKPNAKIAILYQNDDFGLDYLAGVKDVLGAKYKTMVVKQVSYEVTEPTIDSQVLELQGSGADVLITAATPKFAAQAIRKVYDIGWRPLHFMTNVSISVASVIQPAGPEKATGLITAQYGKDPTDPALKDDAGLKEWRGFMAKYMPGADLKDVNYVYAYGVSLTLMQVLQQCAGDFSRQNIMHQAAALHDLVLPTALPGVTVATSPTNYHPIRRMQLAKWDGKAWTRFGGVIGGAGS